MLHLVHERVERLVRVVFELRVERDRVRLAVVAARRPARHIGKFHLGFRDLRVCLKKSVVLQDIPQRCVPLVDTACQLFFRAAVLLVQPQQLGVLRLGELSREHPVHQLRIACVVRIVGAVLRLAAPAECRAGIVDLKPPLPIHAAIPARFLPDGLVVRPALFQRLRAAQGGAVGASGADARCRSSARRSRRLLLRLCPPGRGASFCLGAHGLLHRRVAGEPVQPRVSVRRDLLGEHPLDLVHAHVLKIVNARVGVAVALIHRVVFLGCHALADHLIRRLQNLLGDVVVEQLVPHQRLRADGVSAAVHGVHAEEHLPALGIGVRVAVVHLNGSAHRDRLDIVRREKIIRSRRVPADLPRVHYGHGLRAAVLDAELCRGYLP